MINNRNITILNFIVLSLAVLASSAWLFGNELFQYLSIQLFSVSYFIALLQLIANSRLLTDIRYMLPIFILLFLPYLISRGIAIYSNTPEIPLHNYVFWFASFLILVIYFIRFYNKNNKQLLDKLKLFWVALVCILEPLNDLSIKYGWSYYELIAQMDLIAFIPMIFVFYMSGIRRGKLMMKV